MPAVIEPIQCPMCGKRFKLTADYLAAYGGKTTACACGQALRIPPAAEPAVGAVGETAAASRVALQYARPADAAGKIPDGVWSERDALVLTRGKRLPNRCAACGTPVARPFAPRSLLDLPRVSPITVVLFFVLTLPLFLCVVTIRRLTADKVRARFGYCPDHRPLRVTTAFRVARAVALCSILPLIISAAILGRGRAEVAFVALGLAVAAALFAFVAYALLPQPIEIRAIDPTHVWLGGFGPEYLKLFPSLSAAKDADAADAAANLDQLAAGGR